MANIEQLKSKPVYIYAEAPPRASGSGGEIRQYTNIRAYLDLGFNVELVYIPFRARAERISPELPGGSLVWIEPVLEVPSFLSRMAYNLGFPFQWSLDYFMNMRKAFYIELDRREKMNPGAIHHFEGLEVASCIIGYSPINSVWSAPDIDSERMLSVAKMRTQLGRRDWDYRKQHRYNILKRTEQLVARQSRLILSIAAHEVDMINKDWGVKHAFFFPMSLPTEHIAYRKREWMANGKLRLLHLGKIDSLSSYSSLMFILQEVFPKLSNNILNLIEMHVIGEMTNSDRSKEILEIATAYPQVKFIGFQDNILQYYETADLQVVGTTAATGLRTRIIESFSYGLPVLSTIYGSRGVAYLEADKNILLAETASSFADYLITVVTSPAMLPQLGKFGRETYLKHYQREIAARILANLLEEHMQ